MTSMSLNLFLVLSLLFANSQRMYDKKTMEGHCNSDLDYLDRLDNLRMLELNEVNGHHQEIKDIQTERQREKEEFLTFRLQQANRTSIQQEELQKLRTENKEIRDQLTRLEKIWNVIKDDSRLFHRNCYEMLKKNPNLKGKDDVYAIVVDTNIIIVYCDMTTDGGGWTVLQKRKDGSTDFYRTWEEYKHGFGDPKNNYWIGNDVIHALTRDQDQELRVDLQRFNGETAYAEYSTFYIGNETDKYSISITGYSGTAEQTQGVYVKVANDQNTFRGKRTLDYTKGNSLNIYFKGAKFSTKDEENDSWGGNCATTFHGAWWYKNCGGSNLNGQYAQSAVSDGKYITWFEWKNSYEALQKTVMMIRHKN